MADLYLSDLEANHRADLERTLKEARPDLTQAIDDGDTIVIGSLFDDMTSVHTA